MQQEHDLVLILELSPQSQCPRGSVSFISSLRGECSLLMLKRFSLTHHKRPFFLFNLLIQETTWNLPSSEKCSYNVKSLTAIAAPIRPVIFVSWVSH